MYTFKRIRTAACTPVFFFCGSHRAVVLFASEGNKVRGQNANRWCVYSQQQYKDATGVAGLLVQVIRIRNALEQIVQAFAAVSSCPAHTSQER